jgi:hypothetical protein
MSKFKGSKMSKNGSGLDETIMRLFRLSVRNRMFFVLGHNPDGRDIARLVVHATPTAAQHPTRTIARAIQEEFSLSHAPIVTRRDSGISVAYKGVTPSVRPKEFVIVSASGGERTAAIYQLAPEL